MGIKSLVATCSTLFNPIGTFKFRFENYAFHFILVKFVRHLRLSLQNEKKRISGILKWRICYFICFYMGMNLGNFSNLPSHTIL